MFVHKYSLSLGLKHKKTHASNKRRLTSRSAFFSWSVPATRMTRHILHNVYAILHNVYFLKKVGTCYARCTYSDTQSDETCAANFV